MTLVENICKELDYKSKRYEDRPKSMKELICILPAEWEKLSLAVTKDLQKTCPRGLQ